MLAHVHIAIERHKQIKHNTLKKGISSSVGKTMQKRMILVHLNSSSPSPKKHLKNEIENLQFVGQKEGIIYA